jgi:hypothetical protein
MIVIPQILFIFAVSNQTGDMKPLPNAAFFVP